jgi:hypothetical protein
MDLFDILTWAEILVWTTFLGILILTVPYKNALVYHLDVYRFLVISQRIVVHLSFNCARNTKGTRRILD